MFLLCRAGLGRPEPIRPTMEICGCPRNGKNTFPCQLSYRPRIAHPACASRLQHKGCHREGKPWPSHLLLPCLALPKGVFVLPSTKLHVSNQASSRWVKCRRQGG